jgi:hypothetical protein
MQEGSETGLSHGLNPVSGGEVTKVGLLELEGQGAVSGDAKSCCPVRDGNMAGTPKVANGKVLGTHVQPETNV